MKTKKMIALMLALLMVWAALPWQKAAAGAAYDPNDIAVINGIINAHPELGWPKAPADGSSVPDAWTGKVIWTRRGISHFVEKINLSGTGISGALNVSRLRRLNTLDCSNNDLTELNVSGLTNLQELYCNENQLTGLNVSGLTNLQGLYCCYNQLTGLNVSDLTNLQGLHCDNNQLTGLNVSDLTNLQQLRCDFNQLTGLNVSDLTNLQVLYCNNNQLTGLNVSGLSALQILYCQNNQLTGLNVSDLTNLQQLRCDFNQLTGLNVSGLTNLQKLYCDHNYMADRSAVTGREIDWDGTNFRFDPQYVFLSFTAEQTGGANGTADSTGIKLTFNKDVTGLTADEITLTNGTGEATKGSGVTGSGQTWNLALAQVTKPGDIYVRIANFGAYIVTGDALPVWVHKAGVPVSTVTVTKGTASRSPALPGETVTLTADAAPGGQHFVEWNISPPVQFTDGTGKQSSTAKFIMPAENVTAEAIYAGEFNRADIAVINNIIAANGWKVPQAPADGSSVPGEWNEKVRWTGDVFNRRVNELTLISAGLTGTLDVSGLRALINLHCHGNQLTELNVSGLTALRELYCSSNQLTGLNVSGLTNLQVLDCGANQLTELNVSGLTSLKVLYCYMNQLTGLNVSGLTALALLRCDKNQLSGLALDKDAPYRFIDVKYNYMANTGAVTGTTINWDEVDYLFAPQYRRISYDAHGGSGQMQAGRATDGVSFELPQNRFTAPSGKRFDAWAIGDVSGQMKKAGEQHIFNADTTLYAIWYDPVTGVTLNKNTTTLTVGGSETLTATVAPENATYKDVIWSSDNEIVASLDSSGKVTAVAPGTATITVKTADGEKTATCAVTVVVPVTGVTLNKNTATLTVGGSETLTATVAPENATNKAVTWSSDKPAVADVDQSGKVTAVGVGTATITVKTADGEKTATCAVTVVVPVTGVKLNKTATTLAVGGSETLTATVAPENATNKAVTWSSDKPAVATVDTGGKVTAVAPGTATITVKTVDGGKTATCAVTVVVPVTGVKLNKTATTLAVGGSETLTATVAPENATNKAVTWSSDKPAVATVDQSGKVIAVGGGTATITIKTADGEKTATCAVTVVVPVTGVKLNKTATTLAVGSSETLTATVAPENATNKAVTWSSDKPAVATVDQSGKVIAVGGGTATITIKTADGEKTATCAVTVVVPVTGVKLNKAATSMVVGGAETLFAALTPANATNRNITWSSDKPAITAVDAAGKVTAVAPGTATITVKTADGEKTAACTVTVSAAAVPVTGVKLNKASTTLPVGGAERLAATVEPATATNQNLTWSSDKPDVAAVDAAGKVIAVAPGTATITVKTADGEKTATCAVTAVVPVTGVSLKKTATSMVVGGTETLFAIVTPANATNRNVTWSSDKPAVATVDQSGKVIAAGVGTATITVKTADGGKTATCTVTVSAAAVPVTGVKLDKATAALTVGGAETLYATVEPATATNQNVTWSSDKPAVATVDNGGKVIAVAPGAATITVTTADGGKTATCTVTVSTPVVTVTGVTLNKAATALLAGGAETLFATVEPAAATNRNITWSSDNTAVATVDTDGKVIAVAVGAATITVKTADGGKTATCTVTVSAAAVPVTGVKLDKATAALVVGGAERLVATVEPATATNQNVTWSSDKPDIATVDNSGKVIAVAPGAATITVTTADGGKTASCSITVQPAAAPFAGTVTFDKGAAQVGEPITITWDLPEGASQCSVHAYYWYVKEEGSDARILAESGGGADMSSISFTPTKGKELMLELYLKDSDNQIYTYQSAWISIGGDDPVPPASKGDANNDGAVDILDLVSIIEYIVNGAEPVSKEGADANGDGTVDILDLVWIIEMIVSG